MSNRRRRSSPRRAWDTLYAPDYVINAGGVISVAREYLRQSSKDEMRKEISRIPERLRAVLPTQKRPSGPRISLPTSWRTTSWQATAITLSWIQPLTVLSRRSQTSSVLISRAPSSKLGNRAIKKGYSIEWPASQDCTYRIPQPARATNRISVI
jgi:hypothetical protein